MWRTLFLCIIFSLFSTAVLGYIALATPLGPWIDPIVALIVVFLFRSVSSWIGHKHEEKLAYITVASSIGGILATGIAFSFPALYFLDAQFFNTMLATPAYFLFLLVGLGIAAGSFGFLLAYLFQDFLLERFAFPIGQLTYSIIAVANDQLVTIYHLTVGFFSTLFFCFLQDGVYGLPRLLPKELILMPRFEIFSWTNSPITIFLWPMVWALGFVAGQMMIIPLIVGILADRIVINPMNHFLFPTLSYTEFVLAFCSGMVVYGVIESFFALRIKKVSGTVSSWLRKLFDLFCKRSLKEYVFAGAVLLGISFFLTYLHISWVVQLYLLVCTALWTYQALIQAGTLGLATLGRFATFVMVPAMLLFSLNYLQLVCIATFVEVCSGVAADILFGQKLARLAFLTPGSVRRYQFWGILTASCSAGIVFLFILTNMHIGSSELFALKAQNRALLINVHSFNYSVLFLGGMFGFLLKRKVNASLVLGGILMPPAISLALVAGGMISLLIKKKEQWNPVCAGIFVANVIWIFLKKLCHD